MLFWYGMEIHRIASEAAGTDVSQFMTIKDAEVQTKFDGLLAAATQHVHAESVSVFAKLPPAIQQAQAMLKQYAPPPPTDPGQVAMAKVNADQAQGAAELQQKAQQDAQENALKQAEMAQDGQTAQQDNQTDVQTNAADNQTKVQVAGANNQTKQQVVQSQDATKLTVTAEDNRVAEEIAGAEIAAGKSTNIKDGQAVDKKPTEA